MCAGKRERTVRIVKRFKRFWFKKVKAHAFDIAELLG